MSDSDGSSDECNEEKTEEQTPDTPIEDPKNLPRRMRVRYWHSWEEMLLVELWRKHFDEVTCLDKHLPIFRIISIGMRDSGFHVTGQEVRRKIKTIKNKYVAERRRLNEAVDKNAKSEWNLYPLVHCLMTTPRKTYDPCHEEKELNTILERIKMDPLYHILLSGMPVVSTLKRIEAGEMVSIPPPIQWKDSFPAENKTVAACIAQGYENKHKRSYTPRTPRPSEIAAARAKMLAAEAAAAAPSTAPQAQALPQPSIIMRPTLRGGPLKRLATTESIEQLRIENMKLMEKCVIDRKRLKMEEQQFKDYEKLVEQIKAQYASLFRNLT